MQHSSFSFLIFSSSLVLLQLLISLGEIILPLMLRLLKRYWVWCSESVDISPPCSYLHCTRVSFAPVMDMALRYVVHLSQRSSIGWNQRPLVFLIYYSLSLLTAKSHHFLSWLVFFWILSTYATSPQGLEHATLIKLLVLTRILSNSLMKDWTDTLSHTCKVREQSIRTLLAASGTNSKCKHIKGRQYWYSWLKG